MRSYLSAWSSHAAEQMCLAMLSGVYQQHATQQCSSLGQYISASTMYEQLQASMDGLFWNPSVAFGCS